jgi:hypothetical protein
LTSICRAYTMGLIVPGPLFGGYAGPETRRLDRRDAGHRSPSFYERARSAIVVIRQPSTLEQGIVQRPNSKFGLS